jgi:hypothetical protein
MLDEILKWMGAGDAAIATMGPLMTWLLAVLFGTGFTQFVKFWAARQILDLGLYDWTVRAIAVASTTLFAHVLSDALPWPFEVGIGFSQLFFYHGSRAAIRRWFPWLEVYPVVGSVIPPQAAVDAQRKRLLDKANE